MKTFSILQIYRYSYYFRLIEIKVVEDLKKWICPLTLIGSLSICCQMTLYFNITAQYYDDRDQNQQQIMIANLKTLRQKLTCNVRLAQILAMRM